MAVQGAHGPVLLEDSVLREKIFRCDDEPIAGRLIHARGKARTRFFQPCETLAEHGEGRPGGQDPASEVTTKLTNSFILYHRSKGF